ncbi:hypothetical protein PR202_gb18972 [Eleusine coracana subsp. coracana]|uniref:Uncharacterized protein n=1 Tax=Eleusine coracana subsp. coracana TaxID=191504 RepID=A0AAV5F6C9_ELECO|nr:hypothetical protein PR202_gb18972 [Eleusine coracana subsp. coracana]
MALRGVWQLQKLVVNYCDWGGSSRGIRYFDSSSVLFCVFQFKDAAASKYLNFPHDNQHLLELQDLYGATSSSL